MNSKKDTFIPCFFHWPGTSAELHSSIERLRFEHLGDEEFASDLCSSLRQFVTDRATSNVESLAWMLRGFFEGVRRHIAFEREHILPLVQRHSS